MLTTNEMHNSYNQFLSNSFLSALHVSKDSSCSSSGVQHNILYYTHSILCCTPDDERLDSFETCRADKKLWNKIDYKNCASRWSLIHCNMMHGTHNFKLYLV